MSKTEYSYRKYDVRPYNPAWTNEFEKISAIVRKTFTDDALAIEHIGSTSVPGMFGKSTIDILVLVDDISVASKYVSQMKESDYEYFPEYVTVDTVLFRRIENHKLLTNIHVFQKDHPHVVEMLAVRNYLRTHPEEVKSYSDLKKELFQKYPEDYHAYRKHKDIYMKELEERALSWANSV